MRTFILFTYVCITCEITQNIYEINKTKSKYNFFLMDEMLFNTLISLSPKGECKMNTP